MNRRDTYYCTTANLNPQQRIISYDQIPQTARAFYVGRTFGNHTILVPYGIDQSLANRVPAIPFRVFGLLRREEDFIPDMQSYIEQQVLTFSRFNGVPPFFIQSVQILDLIYQGLRHEAVVNATTGAAHLASKVHVNLDYRDNHNMVA